MQAITFHFSIGIQCRVVVRQLYYRRDAIPRWHITRTAVNIQFPKLIKVQARCISWPGMRLDTRQMNNDVMYRRASI